MLTEKRFRQLFRIGIFLKAVDGVLEFAGGILLLLISKESLNQIVTFLTQHELSEDPNDLVANYLIHAVHHLSASTKQFGALYLLFHGAVKIFLVVGLFRDKLWAYPSAMVFLVAFIGYQLYRYSLTHSVALILLTAFDVLIVFLIWHEYRYLKRTGGFR
jgi:uncharacterized membrane protein